MRWSVSFLLKALVVSGAVLLAPQPSLADDASNLLKIVAIQQAQLTKQAKQLADLSAALTALQSKESTDNATVTAAIPKVPTKVTTSLTNCHYDDVVQDNQGSAFGVAFSYRLCSGQRVATGVRVWQTNPNVTDRVICCDLSVVLAP